MKVGKTRGARGGGVGRPGDVTSHEMPTACSRKTRTQSLSQIFRNGKEVLWCVNEFCTTQVYATGSSSDESLQYAGGASPISYVGSASYYYR
jgi:hypothetical protein